jgi:hypothetical protein
VTRASTIAKARIVVKVRAVAALIKARIVARVRAAATPRAVANPSERTKLFVRKIHFKE